MNKTLPYLRVNSDKLTFNIVARRPAQERSEAGQSDGDLATSIILLISVRKSFMTSHSEILRSKMINHR